MEAAVAGVATVGRDFTVKISDSLRGTTRISREKLYVIVCNRVFALIHGTNKKLLPFVDFLLRLRRAFTGFVEPVLEFPIVRHAQC